MNSHSLKILCTSFNLIYQGASLVPHHLLLLKCSFTQFDLKRMHKRRIRILLKGKKPHFTYIVVLKAISAVDETSSFVLKYYYTKKKAWPTKVGKKAPRDSVFFPAATVSF